MTRLFLFVPRSQLHQKRKHSLWHVLRNLIERLQFLSNRGARGTTRQCFRPGHVIRFMPPALPYCHFGGVNFSTMTLRPSRAITRLPSADSGDRTSMVAPRWSAMLCSRASKPRSVVRV